MTTMTETAKTGQMLANNFLSKRNVGLQDAWLLGEFYEWLLGEGEVLTQDDCGERVANAEEATWYEARHQED